MGKTGELVRSTRDAVPHTTASRPRKTQPPANLAPDTRHRQENAHKTGRQLCSVCIELHPNPCHCHSHTEWLRPCCAPTVRTRVQDGFGFVASQQKLFAAFVVEVKASGGVRPRPATTMGGAGAATVRAPGRERKMHLYLKLRARDQRGGRVLTGHAGAGNALVGASRTRCRHS
eukprot:597120-Rhodomonas_salina.2